MHTDYYAFGMQMPGRTWQGIAGAYRYGMNTQEKDDEIYTGAYGAKFWEYDSRIGRRWNLDPKPTAGVSDYACFLNSPIQIIDHDGDEVKYEKFRDKVNSFFARLFNKGYREKFKEWDKSADIFTITKTTEFIPREPVSGEAREVRLIHADPCETSCLNGVSQHAVYYNKGFRTNDISNKGLRLAFLPFDLAFNIAKIPIAALSGISIGIHNIFTDKKHDIGWGWGNRIELSPNNKGNLLGWGFGNFNKYNMFGKNLNSSPFGNKKLHPDGFLGFRFGVGHQRVNFIDIGPDAYNSRTGYSYHAHFNIAGPNTRRAEMRNEKGVDFKH